MLSDLLDEFDAHTFEWRQEAIFEGDYKVEWERYSAYVMKRGTDRYKASVERRDFSRRTQICDAYFEDLGNSVELAKNAALKAIRTDLIRRDFEKRGPDRVMQLESDVAELRLLVEQLRAAKGV